jgi:hypothetical protein
MKSCEAPLPAQCGRCLDQSEKGTWNKSPEDAVNCLTIGEVPEARLPELPCFDISTYIGGAGNFQNLPEALFNNRRHLDPGTHVSHGKVLFKY